MNAELRLWRPNDAEALHHAVERAGDLHEQFGDADLSTVDGCTRFIVERLGTPNEEMRNFAISVGGRAVGNAGVSKMEHRNDTGWMYYWLAVEARGHGLATRSLATVAEWAFSDGQLFRLELGHRVNNFSSCRVATRAGFAAEGVERQKLRYGPDRFDVETHARLATDRPPHIELLSLR